METHEIRREYVAPHLIPKAYKGPQQDIIIFEAHRFKILDVLPAALIDTLFNDETADALTVYRRRWIGREAKPTPWDRTRQYRVIAPNGKPTRTAEYTDVTEALRAAVIQAKAGADALERLNRAGTPGTNQGAGD